MSYALVAFLVAFVAGVIGHLLLKKGMNQIGEVSIIRNGFMSVVKKAFKNFNIWLGVIVEGVGMAGWVVALSGMDLSFAYPVVTSLNYVAIAVGSYFLFGEEISKQRWLSIAVIIAGVVLISFSY